MTKILKYQYSGQIHSEDPTHEEQHLAYKIPQRQCKLYAPSASSILHHSCDCRRSDHDSLMSLSWDTHSPLRSLIGKLLEHCLRRRMNHHNCNSFTFRVLLPESCSYRGLCYWNHTWMTLCQSMELTGSQDQKYNVSVKFYEMFASFNTLNLIRFLHKTKI